jgi:hypothetical protein
MLTRTFFFYLSDKEAQARRRAKPASETSMGSSKQVKLAVGKSIFTFNSWKKEAYEGRMVGLLCSLILDLGSV